MVRRTFFAGNKNHLELAAIKTAHAGIGLYPDTDVQQLELSDAGDPPAFQAGSRAALFFERRGMQGLIRGVVVVEGDQVVDLLILQSREGLDHNALDSPGFRSSFRHRPAKPPLIVDAVSGATISSQAVTDAVNVRLAQWVKYTAWLQKRRLSKRLLPCCSAVRP